MDGRGWVGVDLDGTLAEYDGWRGLNHIGEPVKPMVDRVKKFLQQGVEVRIFTARVAHDGSENGKLLASLARKMIESWCETYLGQKLAVTNQKDMLMVDLYDDRCRQVIANTGEVVGEINYP